MATQIRAGMLWVNRANTRPTTCGGRRPDLAGCRLCLERRTIPFKAGSGSIDIEAYQESKPRLTYFAALKSSAHSTLGGGFEGRRERSKGLMRTQVAQARMYHNHGWREAR